VPTARQIMEKATVLLADDDHTRWPLSELCTWINEAVQATVLAKPSASTASRAITLQKGTLQKVPSTGAPEPLMLQRLVRNLVSADDPRAGGRIITVTSRESLDAQAPHWHDPTRVRYQRDVRHYVYDENNPLEFYVYPGNDGTGVVEAVLSVLPAATAPSGDPDDLASYETDIGLSDLYSVPLTDYVLFRAFAKDDLDGQPGRSMAHYQLFASAVGLKIQVEGATSPNRRKT